MEDESRDGGFIKLFRSLLDWGWYTDQNTKALFIHCLLKANYTDKNWRGTPVPRGSFISSISTLAAELGLSERAIRTAITHLKSTGELTSKSTNKFTLFTVENYELYQGVDRQADRQATSKRQASDRQPTTTKKEKKEKKEKNNPLNPPFRRGRGSHSLPDWWDDIPEDKASPEEIQAVLDLQKELFG